MARPRASPRGYFYPRLKRFRDERPLTPGRVFEYKTPAFSSISRKRHRPKAIRGHGWGNTVRAEVDSSREKRRCRWMDPRPQAPRTGAKTMPTAKRPLPSVVWRQCSPFGETWGFG